MLLKVCAVRMWHPRLRAIASENSYDRAEYLSGSAIRIGDFRSREHSLTCTFAYISALSRKVVQESQTRRQAACPARIALNLGQCSADRWSGSPLLVVPRLFLICSRLGRCRMLCVAWSAGPSKDVLKLSLCKASGSFVPLSRTGIAFHSD